MAVKMPVPREQILEQLAKMLAGSTFESASRSRALLEFVVRETVAGRAEQLKEYTIGVGVLGRADHFDPRTDPIVRAEASRLRTKLEAYYAGEGKEDAVEIALPRGTYVPQFTRRMGGEGGEEVRPGRRSLWPIGLGVGAVVVLVVAVWGLAGWREVRGREVRGQAVYLDVELRTGDRVASQAGPDFAISPDGSKIVFVAISKQGVARLYLKRMDRLEITMLEGTEGARVPFFSADGSAVGFWAASKLKKTLLGGGAPVVLCEATDLLGGSWGEDGWIVAAMERQKLSRIAATGGKPEVILDLSKEGRVPAWPQVLAGGKGIVFTALGFDGADRARVELLRPETGARRTLAVGATHGRIAGERWLIYANQSTLYAQELERGTLAAVGEPVATPLRVAYSSTFGYSQFDISAGGTLVCRRTSGLGTPHWIGEGGEPGEALLPPGRYVQPAVSRDGRRVAITETVSGLSRVVIGKASGEVEARLPSPAQFGVWSGDGEFVVLGAMPHLGWARADGRGGVERLTRSKQLQSPGSFSPDGKTLVYGEFDGKRGFDLWTVAVGRKGEGLEAGEPRPFLQTGAFETHPSFSPDGKWVSYASNASGRWEVYVRAYPDRGWEVRVSPDGGRVSRWSRTKPELLFRTDRQELMVAGYEVRGGKIEFGKVREFAGPKLADTGVLANFDVGVDGRVLAILPASGGGEEQTVNHVTLVMGFVEELKGWRAGAR